MPSSAADTPTAVEGGVLAIVGPTASGKSAAAMELAVELDAEIVSCDSMQVYRGFDVGTAKPSARERARVQHHLVDVADAIDRFSAARYVELADQALSEIAARRRPALVVGGTGLYLRALRRGLCDAPARDEALRERLYAEERARPGLLHLRLLAVDPVTAARVQSADLVRVVRALEVFELTGVPLSRHHASQPSRPPRGIRVAVIDAEADLLQARIEDRTREMLAAGLVEETRRLRARWPAAAPPLGAVGYRETSDFLDGRIAEGDLPEAIVRATRRYARRQRTWFRKEADVVRYASAEALVAGELPRLRAIIVGPDTR